MCAIEDITLGHKLQAKKHQSGQLVCATTNNKKHDANEKNIGLGNNAGKQAKYN